MHKYQQGTLPAHNYVSAITLVDIRRPSTGCKNQNNVSTIMLTKWTIVHSVTNLHCFSVSIDSWNITEFKGRRSSAPTTTITNISLSNLISCIYVVCKEFKAASSLNAAVYKFNVIYGFSIFLAAIPRCIGYYLSSSSE